MSIKNIIFDLGGVIINIDYRRTADAFRKLGAINFDEIYTQTKQDRIFDEFDVGKISSDDFRNSLKKKLALTINDGEFDSAWNAMLLDIPKNRLDFIMDLRNNYRVFLFSNTNDIHLKEVFNICQTQNGFNTFEKYFEKEYYSHLFGKRKPSAEAFISILNDNKMNANETLFVDDSLQHIDGARKAGMNAIHLSGEKSIFDIMRIINDAHYLHGK